MSGDLLMMFVKFKYNDFKKLKKSEENKRKQVPGQQNRQVPSNLQWIARGRGQTLLASH